MRIAVDLQACQTPDSRQRGIGRYSLELAKAIVRNRGTHEVRFLVNRAFDEHVAGLSAEFAKLDPGLAFEAYDLAPLAGTHGVERRRVQRVNDAIINWRYACTGADAVHVSSVFEGWLTGAAHVTARPADVVGALMSATLYDLIPLLFSDIYLAPEVRGDYFAKLGVFQQLDLVLAISESARQDAIHHLALRPERVVNIRAATSDAFHRYSPTDDEVREVLDRHGLGRRFVLYTGGIDYRKNIELLLEAYAGLPPPLRADVQLAIVCSVLPEQREDLLRRCARLGIASGRVVLTGFVSDADLNLLYNTCELFVFPSLYEGFGLPVLEAMTCGACVIAADASSMPEIVGRRDVLFDPRDPRAIADMMAGLLGAPQRRRELADCNVRRAREFSWDRCGREAVAALEDAHARRDASRVAACARRVSRVAVLSPLPPQRSGIASYSAALLPHWSRHWDIDLVVDGYAASLEGIPGAYTMVDLATFRRNAPRYDGILYHLGNSEFHAAMLDELPRHPGVVVMHDFFLSGLLHWLDATGRRPGMFARELVRSHGPSAQADLAGVARGEAPLHDIIYRYPASRSVFEHAQGVIFHSPYAQREFASAFPDLAAVPTCVVPHFALPAYPEPGERAAARAALGLAPDERLVCAFGFLAETKLNHALLDAFASAPLADDRRVRVAFVGELPRGEYRKRILRQIAGHPLRDRISITGYVDEATYRRYQAATDVAVSLRALSRGETSGALQKNLAAGCATVVSEYATMRDVPDSVARKVPPGDPRALSAALQSLLADDALRHSLGEAARRYAEQELHPARIAQQYALWFDELRARDAARSARHLVREVGRRIAEGQLDGAVAAAAGDAIAAGLTLHPAAGRWLSRSG